jgi:DHA2 family multidrug resistance protein
MMEALWTSNTSVAHSSLAAHVIPGDVNVQAALGPALTGAAPGALETLNDQITRQAAMVAYVDDFKLMLFITLACMPLLLLMRTPKLAPEEGVHVIVE